MQKNLTCHFQIESHLLAQINRKMLMNSSLPHVYCKKVPILKVGKYQVNDAEFQ